MSQILRKRLTRGWTGVPNATIRDRSLSFRATGVLVFLLSMDDGWSMSAATVAERKGGEGRDAVGAALKELRAAGYMRHVKLRDRGRFVTEVEVSDVPVAEWLGGALVDLTVTPELPISEDGTNNGFSGVGDAATNDGISGTGQPAPGAPSPGAPSVGASGDQEKTLAETLEVPEVDPSPTAAPSRALDDPVKAKAHKLTTLAFEQEVKPVLRGAPNANAFPAVMAMFERLLRAGVIVGDLERAVRNGIGVWTVHGIQTSIARNKPNRLAGPAVEDLQSAHERAAARDAAAEADRAAS